MTDDEYLDSWLDRLGKCLDGCDEIGRLRLMREARARPSMTLVVTAMEFALSRIDNAVSAAKMAKEIALRAKAMVSVKARTIQLASGSTVGVDASSEKHIELVPHG